MKKILIFAGIFLLFSAGCRHGMNVDSDLDAMPTFRPFKFGIIADAQYSDKNSKWNRQYRKTPEKLRQAVRIFNEHNVDFVVVLGDLIDNDFDNFDKMLKILSRLGRRPLFFVLGNHEFCVSDDKKNEVIEKLRMPNGYYSIVYNQYRLIVLDGTDVYANRYPKGSKKHKESKAFVKKQNLGKFPFRNTGDSAIGKEQLKWLDKNLEAAILNNEKVILLCHFPVLPSGPLTLINSKDIVGIIDKNPTIVAYLCGHNHLGSYVENNGVHYLNFLGMVDTSANAFAIVKVYDDRLEVEGFGRETNRILKIPSEREKKKK